jgi:hypothetical protein
MVESSNRWHSLWVHRCTVNLKTFFYPRAKNLIVSTAYLAVTMMMLAAEPSATQRATTSTTGDGVRTSKSPWSNVLMIGASASAGFTVSEPFGGVATQKLRLNRYVDAALIESHAPVSNVASAYFFLQPEVIARKQINDVLRNKPSLVLGLDFLFWFCYGDIRTNENRLERFEKGLKLLEEIECPVVVGNIPDASAAANGMLAPSQIPSLEIIAAANRRLNEWAKGRKQIVLVDLADFMRTTMANEALTLHGKTFPKGKTRAFLQDDKLHPSSFGDALLALAMIDALQQSQPDTFTAPIRWEAEDVLRIGSATSTNAPSSKISSNASKN